jgi:alkylation response protein AidB-like acyl-CoA dehydrogenase
MVEKIKRDVRITTIYEGPSEILEWTTARDRWQLHLKSRGAHYLDWAKRVERLHAERADVGANNAAIALRGLAAVMERCRVDKLTRHQHVLFRLGELVAQAEGAAVFAQRAATAPTKAIRCRPPRSRRCRACSPAKPPRASPSRVRGGHRCRADRPRFPARDRLEPGPRRTGRRIEDMDVISGSLAETFPA